MQKLLSFVSYGNKEFTELNTYFQNGWVVKQISSCQLSPNNLGALVTVLLEKQSN